ncbi:MAG: hypothetical protein JXQ90_07590 [Cyclobacteriaceae bacterium]
MEQHYTLTDESFKEQFANLTLSPSLFTHEAHIRLAWIHIRDHGILEAIDNIRTQIKRFAAHHGDPDKYNETLTVAAVRVVYHFMHKHEYSSYKSFIQENPRLISNFKALIKTHYSFDIFSKQAKENFLVPDLVPFNQI